ncbi:peptidase S9 prolyl oligopeptidase active site domain protein [Rhodotorula toruloides]|uniref:Peptidase S9 prolyl oligopeptidase active site domain protein n=1 Tax=Rhodotorula toruloides TaxID=5286 RepID=A0A511KPJ1_RHOTO|nr:peptidase S9 prolyl oligopeptidase active site domain protein [Rhodotorula toruloides]
MAGKTTAQYGAWRSPISTDLVLASAVSLGEPKVSPTRSALAWLEGRPQEKGRNAIVYQRIQGGEQEQVLPDAKWNARTRVQEYGGASWSFESDDSIVFSSMEGPAYRVRRSADGKWSEPEQVTPESSVLRYADFAPHPSPSLSSALTLSILEDHTNDTPATVVTTLVALSTSDRKYHTVASGADFYAAPEWSPSGRYICWVQWMHPDMPWEGSELYVARVNNPDKPDTANLIDQSSIRKVAGKPKNGESISQPRWAQGDKDTLVFLGDRTGFYELYKYEPEGDKEVKPLLKEPTGADVGGPDWVLGQQTHMPLSSTQWISNASGGKLRIISLADGSSELVDTPYVSVGQVDVVSPTQVAVLGAPATAPSVISLLELPKGGGKGTEKVLKVSSSASVDSAFISKGEKIEYPTRDGSKAYGLFYAPSSGTYVAPEGSLPPLVVRCHGGPTASARRGLDWMIAFFTSRGFAYVDVDYGGSTGYGKEFRERLSGTWGIVDVEDTISCVEWLVQQGKVDKSKVAITGGSAGGFTVLASLCDSKIFTAGTSSYGVSDLKLLAEDTHKFESNYLFKLLGGTPAEVPTNYHDRSPIFKASQITAPLLLLQGTDDKVVPQSQAETMLEEVKKNGSTCEMILFEGEGHGFRGRDARKRAMEAELGWYRKTWGIEADE